MPETIQALDAQIMLFVQEHLRFDALTPIMRLASFLGEAGMLWIAVTVVLLCIPATRKQGVVVGLSLAAATALNNLVIKNLVARPRPYSTLEALEILVEPLGSYSFPSGHSCASFAAATALTLVFGKKGAWAFLPAALIALSRVYVGVHYPTDILCGAAVGALAAWGVWALCRWCAGRWRARRSRI